MQLKSIEMIGFKSFADRTYVELKDGITGIVGPNGCGKSNIVDALRWCLGEMSAKSLRSKHMMDVIFAGSSNRAALSFSEVTVTFDNSHKLLPIDYTDVQISRRLFRSGESEYFLNKTQCRLKDIKDLMMDTGVGDGYSILAQGEVAFVVNAKPDERRELFEEAAGISKYKARREETLRKLEKVDQDLSRLNDIISMVRDQMTSLEAAAKKAKLFQKLKDELKNLEITDFLNQIKISDHKIGESQQKIEQLRNQAQEAITQLDTAEAESTQNQINLDECDRELYKLNSAILELDKQINHLDQNIAFARQREQEYEQKQAKSESQIGEFDKDIANTQGKIEQIRQEIDQAKTSALELKDSYEAQKSAWESMKNERRELDASKDQYSRELFQMAGEINEAKNEQNRLTSMLYNKEFDISNSKKEWEKAVAEQARLAAEIEGLTETVAWTENSILSFEKDSSELRNSHQDLDQKVAQLNEKISMAKQTIVQRETQIKAIEESFESHPYKKGTQAVLKQNFDGCRGVVGILLKYADNMSPWVESALGSRINHIVFDRQDQAEQALDWLKKTEFGRATCIILEKIPEARTLDISQLPIANPLLSFIQADPALDTLKNYLLGGAYLAGNTLYDVGTIDGGSDQTFLQKQTGLQGSENQFLLKERFSAELAQSQSDLKAFEQDLAATQAALNENQANLSEKEKSLEKVRVQKDHSVSVAAKLRQEKELTDREIEVYKNRFENSEKEKAEHQAKLDGLAEKIAAYLETQKQKESERNDLNALIEEKRAQEHQSELVAKEAEVRLESSESHLRRIEQSFQEWNSLLAEYQRNIKDAQEELEICKVQIVEQRESQQKDSVKLQELQAEKQVLNGQTEEWLNKKTGYEANKAGFHEKIQALRESQMRISEEVHAAELEHRTFENDKNNVLQKLQENYQMTVEEATAQNVGAEATPEEIAKLKKRVESMSNSVNLEAPEQYQGLEERYTFLTTQLTDLQKAKEDLKVAIQQINTTTREQFRDTFEKVRENFKKVFSSLFVGGTADLVFTDEHNLLETGIDIVAQPAGKKLQSIVLLSGGEKTLTAIALLFAFFMVKPSPMCVLDEVDAPLDAVNVNRYINLLKDFISKTQFLVVTHNPRTMEACDILYGVTMEESGVSKVLSAKIKKEVPQEAHS